MISRNAARRAAVQFMRDYAGRRWTVRSVEAYLPSGYVLEDVRDSDFFPLTLTRVTNVIQRHAKQETVYITQRG